MDTATSDFVIGIMMAVFGLIGLILAASAVDDGIYVFGLSLFGFACVFNLGLVRAFYDRRDAMRAHSSAPSLAPGSSDHV